MARQYLIPIEELQALPCGSVIISSGGVAWTKHGDDLWGRASSTQDAAVWRQTAVIAVLAMMVVYVYENEQLPGMKRLEPSTLTYKDIYQRRLAKDGLSLTDVPNMPKPPGPEILGACWHNANPGDTWHMYNTKKGCPDAGTVSYKERWAPPPSIKYI